MKHWDDGTMRRSNDGIVLRWFPVTSGCLYSTGFGTQASFYEAEDECEFYGGTLAQILDEDTHNFLSDYIKFLGGK